MCFLSSRLAPVIINTFAVASFSIPAALSLQARTGTGDEISKHLSMIKRPEVKIKWFLQ